MTSQVFKIRRKTQDARRKRVFIGLSGGVDSSVSALLLKQQGYDVVGVFITVWNPVEEIEGMNCRSEDDRRDAMRVCAHLSIPFRDLDLSAVYKKEVIDYMIDEYKIGRTPNPDVFCNKYVKFGAFFDFAMKEGADYVATGHYSQIENSQIENVNIKNQNYGSTLLTIPNLSRNNTKYENYKLKIANDLAKDQTYFLWNLNQKHLSRTLFPVGHLQKSEVRKLAKKFSLPTADKKDSQGLCFLGPIDIKEFLSHYIEKNRGKVLDDNGKEIGYHGGAEFFALGERHGFTITDKTPNDKPSYVISKDIKKNTISVAFDPIFKRSEQNEFLLESVNWTNAPFLGKCEVRFRYREKLHSCEILYKNKKTFVKVFEPTLVSPGQSAVFYKNGECLGGGVIN